MQPESFQGTSSMQQDLPSKERINVFCKCWTAAVDSGWPQGTGYIQYCTLYTQRHLPPQHKDFCAWTHSMDSDILLLEAALNVTDAKLSALNFSGARGCSLVWVLLTIEINLFWEADICLHATLKYTIPFHCSVNREIFFDGRNSI